MCLSLLRSPTSPDPKADIGRHSFRYALLPHNGNFREAGVINAAQAFNVPMIVCSTATDPAQRSFFTVNQPGIIIDTVKQAEDSKAVIVRLYEAFGAHTTAQLSSPLKFQRATRCNLLEEDEQKLKWTNHGARLSFHPFEIVTLKLQ
jgi:alpha-mannosidase